MQKATAMFVGLDDHKGRIAAAYAPREREAEAVFVGQSGTRLCDIDKLVRRLRPKASTLVSVCEVGWMRDTTRKPSRAQPSLDAQR